MWQAANLTTRNCTMTLTLTLTLTLSCTIHHTERHKRDTSTTMMKQKQSVRNKADTLSPKAASQVSKQGAIPTKLQKT